MAKSCIYMLFLNQYGLIDVTIMSSCPDVVYMYIRCHISPGIPGLDPRYTVNRTSSNYLFCHVYRVIFLQSVMGNQGAHAGIIRYYNVLFLFLHL